MNWEQLGSLLWTGTVDTLYMTFWSSVIAYLIGLPLGVLLVVTRRDGIMPSPGFNSVLGVLVNFLRSIPFIIMLAMLFPVTRAVMGTAIGTRSIIFPLVVSAFPYVARMVESSLEEVDHGIIEAAQSMGSTNFQIIFKVLLPESSWGIAETCPIRVFAGVPRSVPAAVSTCIHLLLCVVCVPVNCRRWHVLTERR